MALWGVIELAVTTVGTYNIFKGFYNMYCDAEKIKDEYRSHQKITKDYLQAQGVKYNPLTESQFQRFEDEFLVMQRSQIIDPYNFIYQKDK